MGERGLDRRTFLLSVGASSILAACGGGGGSSAPTPALTPTPGTGTVRVPLSIDLTSANLPTGTLAYAYVVGGLYTTTNLTTFENYRLDAAGNVHALSTTDNTNAAGTFPDLGGTVSSADSTTIAATYPSAWADYSIPLSLTSPTVIEFGKINTANIPGLGTGNNAFSARVYISVGVPRLPFTVQAATTGSVSQVNPYAAPGFDAGTPGALCLFDWFEFSMDSNGILNGNPTLVDQFALPLTVDASPGGAPQGTMNITRAAIFNNIAAFPQTVYQGLTLPVTAPSAYPANTAYLRALSPDHLSSIGSGTNTGATNFQNYFDSEISAWMAQQITVTDTSTGTYASTPGSWTFSPVAPTTGSAISFGTITTANIWQCNGSLASGSAAQQNIGKQILAAFNRGVMSTTLDDGACPPASSFYPSGVSSNLWAQSFHAWSTNGMAYGFAYDDVCGANPSFNTTAALTSLSITLGAMF